VVAVNHVSFEVAKNGAMGIVGESGSGKTTLARCLIRLHEPDAGSIVFRGRDITQADGAELLNIRRRIQMVFQDPYTSLNPRLSVGAAILEAGRVHGRVPPADGRQFVEGLLERVGLSQSQADRRPHSLSGGQRQRVAIARALAVGPELLIADEAVSALDVSVQAQILNLFADLRSELGLTLIFISHQLAVISHLCDHVAIMYLGRIVEYGSTECVFANPQHPYTRALLEAHPDPDPRRRAPPALHGDAPTGLNLRPGCPFSPRCAYSEQVCEESDPELERDFAGQAVACHVRPFRRVA
jgi:oligopeptide/dipeptide ABC transporter ATP-binding protein